MINTIVIFDEVKEAMQTSGKITASYSVKQSPSSGRKLNVRES